MRVRRRFGAAVLGLAVLGLTLGGAGESRADPIINNTGIANPARTITFSEFSPPAGTPITTQYSSLGVTFSPSVFYNVQPVFFPTASVANFDPNGNANNPVTIQFSQNQTAAAFALQTNPGTSTFTALLNGTPVQTFTAPTALSVVPDLTNASNYYGFQGIVFNQIRITANTTFFQLDNLQLSSIGPVVTPTGPVLYGGNGNGSAVTPGGLVTINQMTGAGAPVGDPVTPGGLTGLAFDSAGRLFGSTINGGVSTLVRIDPLTGAVLATIGTITFGGVPISIGDLSFQPGTDILFGFSSNAAGGGGRLYRIDTATGVATLVGDSGTLTGGGIAFAPDGTLYQTGFSVGRGFFALNTLNPTTGAVLTSIPINGYFDGLAVRPTDGVLFAVGGGPGDDIDTINPITGAITFVGNTGTGSPSDLAFLLPAAPGPAAVPEPSSLALLALGGLGLAGWRRWRKRTA